MNTTIRTSALLLAAAFAHATAVRAEVPVAPGAQPVELGKGFVFTEGPVADADGNVYFSDIPNGRIHKWHADTGKIEVWREKSGGANGNYFYTDGKIVSCEGTARQVTATDFDANTVVLTDSFEGKKYNGPNDCWVHPDGSIYFTDPKYGSTEGLEMGGMHVYRIAPDLATVTRVVDDMERPNGIIGTPDGKILYIADHGAEKTWKYSIAADGSLKDKTLFAEQGSDGVTLDEKGNLYLTDTGVTVYSPEGKLLGKLEFPLQPANVTFGGKDGKLLFVTARTAVFGLKMTVGGMK